MDRDGLVSRVVREIATQPTFVSLERKYLAAKLRLNLSGATDGSNTSVQRHTVRQAVRRQQNRNRQTVPGPNEETGGDGAAGREDDRSRGGADIESEGRGFLMQPAPDEKRRGMSPRKWCVLHTPRRCRHRYRHRYCT